MPTRQINIAAVERLIVMVMFPPIGGRRSWRSSHDKSLRGMNFSMEVIEPIDEDTMVMAWVEAERAAPLRQANIEIVIAGRPLTPALAGAVLALTRGYPIGLIFTELPPVREWERVRVTVEELGDFSYLKFDDSEVLTRGSFLVKDGAANVDTVKAGDLNERVRKVEAAVLAGSMPGPLIAVVADGSDTPVVIEGVTRSTAYVRCKEPDDAVEMILGRTPGFGNWAFRPPPK